MEARRRLAKRGMTAQTAFYPANGISAPLFDLRALFGFRQSEEPSWRYEPPSVKAAEPLTPPCGDVSSSPGTSLVVAVADGLSDNARDALPKTFSSTTEISQMTLRKETEHAVIAVKGYAQWDVDRCFFQFKVGIAAADSIPRNRRGKWIKQLILTRCLLKDETGRFALLVLRHLRDVGRTEYIPACFASPLVQLPSIYTTEGMEFLQVLEALAQSAPHFIQGTGRLYIRLAHATLNAQAADVSSQDSRLYRLIRGVWHFTVAQGETDASTMECLRKLNEKIIGHCQKKWLGWMLRDPKNAVGGIICMVEECTRKPSLLPQAVEVLACIPGPFLHRWIPTICSGLVHPQRITPRSSVNSRQCIETWLKLLYHYYCKASGVAGIQLSSDLVSQHRAGNLPNRHQTVLTRKTLVTALLYSLAGHGSFAHVGFNRVKDFITLYAPLLERHATTLPLNELLAWLIAKLQKFSLRNHGVLDLMIPMIYQHRGLRAVVDILSRIERQGVLLTKTAFLKRFTAQVLNDVRKAPSASALHDFEKWLRVQGAFFVETADLERDLQALQAQQGFQRILDRAKDAHVVPLAYQDTPADTPMRKRVELIHQLAYQYSMDRTRSYKQNWRAVYSLYKYLCDNKLEIGPLFTRAVTRISIIQPLSENHFVTSRRLTWVCQLVAQVEGEAVARQIEQTVWLWRGDLILYAKNGLVAGKADGRAHVATMKRLSLI